jgi:hypothetical protein
MIAPKAVRRGSAGGSRRVRYLGELRQNSGHRIHVIAALSHGEGHDPDRGIGQLRGSAVLSLLHGHEADHRAYGLSRATLSGQARSSGGLDASRRAARAHHLHCRVTAAASVSGYVPAVRHGRPGAVIGSAMAGGTRHLCETLEVQKFPLTQYRTRYRSA